MVERKCEQCGKEFQVKFYRKDKARFCSYKCYWGSLIGSNSERKTGRYIRCKLCKKEFWVQPNEEKIGRKYCSSKCYHNSFFEPRIKKICIQCKKEFLVISREVNRKVCCRKCSDLYYKSKNGHNWKGGITLMGDLLRNTIEYKEWRKVIFERDNYTCQLCKKEDNGNLHVHHLKMISKIFEDYNIKTVEEAINCKELWDINNGITLCKNCHGRIRYSEEKYIPIFQEIINSKQVYAYTIAK